MYNISASRWMGGRGMRKVFSRIWAMVRTSADQPGRSDFVAGTEHYLCGDYTAAIAAYDRVIRVRPDMAEVWSNRGLVYHVLGDYAGA